MLEGGPGFKWMSHKTMKANLDRGTNDKSSFLHILVSNIFTIRADLNIVLADNKLAGVGKVHEKCQGKGGDVVDGDLASIVNRTPRLTSLLHIYRARSLPRRGFSQPSRLKDITLFLNDIT